MRQGKLRQFELEALVHILLNFRHGHKALTPMAG